MTKCIKRIRDLFEYVLYKFTLYFTLLCLLKPRQSKSNRLLKLLTLHAGTTSSGSESHSLTNLFTKNVSGDHIYTTRAPICIYDSWYHNAFLAYIYTATVTKFLFYKNN